MASQIITDPKDRKHAEWLYVTCRGFAVLHDLGYKPHPYMCGVTFDHSDDAQRYSGFPIHDRTSCYIKRSDLDAILEWLEEAHEPYILTH